MFQFSMPVEVIGGVDALRRNASRLRELGDRCLILTGGSAAKRSGALEDACAVLAQQKISYTIFDQIGPNPLISACHRAGTVAREAQACFILGIGGGSPLDAAKAAAVYAANPDFAPADIYARTPANPALPIAVIGTTAGTGSEVTAIAVLTDDETGKKKSVWGRHLYARLAFADAKYTHSMPLSVTRATALDALAHAVEGWVKPGIDEMGKLFAAKAISLLWEGLSKLQGDAQLPNAALRTQFYDASLYAGLVINISGTAFCHPMGYILTEDYGVAHGIASAVFLPALLERTAQFAPETYQEIAAAFPQPMDEVCKTIAQLAACPQVQMTQEEIAGHQTFWQQNPPKNFAASPGGLQPEEAARLLSALFLAGC